MMKERVSSVYKKPQVEREREGGREQPRRNDDFCFSKSVDRMLNW